jgi:hypothetical protein
MGQMVDMRKKKRKVDKRKEKVMYLKGMIFCEASFIVILGAYSCCSLFCLEAIRWCYNLVETFFCVGAFNNANNYNLVVVHSQLNHI